MIANNKPQKVEVVNMPASTSSLDNVFVPALPDTGKCNIKVLFGSIMYTDGPVTSFPIQDWYLNIVDEDFPVSDYLTTLKTIAKDSYTTATGSVAVTFQKTTSGGTVHVYSSYDVFTAS